MSKIDTPIPQTPGGSGSFTTGSEETWRTLYNFPHWEVSNRGRFRKTFVHKLHTNDVGYSTLNLSHERNQRKIAAHRAVWEAFNGRIPPELMINHKNGIKTDNRIENLELVTNRENIDHYRDNLLTYRGEKVRTAKLTEEKVREIRCRYENGVSSHHLAKEYGVNPSSIKRIIARKNWKHVA